MPRHRQSTASHRPQDRQGWSVRSRQSGLSWHIPVSGTGSHGARWEVLCCRKSAVAEQLGGVYSMCRRWPWWPRHRSPPRPGLKVHSSRTASCCHPGDGRRQHRHRRQLSAQTLTSTADQALNEQRSHQRREGKPGHPRRGTGRRRGPSGPDDRIQGRVGIQRRPLPARSSSGSPDSVLLLAPFQRLLLMGWANRPAAAGRLPDPGESAAALVLALQPLSTRYDETLSIVMATS